MTPCAWCGSPFTPNTVGRPRQYCSIPCRQDANHYTEALPGLTARLAELESAAAGYRGRLPSFLRIELDVIRDRIAQGPHR